MITNTDHHTGLAGLPDTAQHLPRTALGTLNAMHVRCLVMVRLAAAGLLLAFARGVSAQDMIFRWQ